MVVPFSFAFRGNIHPGGEIMTKTKNPRVFSKTHINQLFLNYFKIKEIILIYFHFYVFEKT